VYWLLDMFEKVSLISGVVMGILYRLTGQFERGVRWPARWLRTTNRGLRSMNCKVVILKGPWWREFVSALSYLLPIGAWVDTPGSNYQFVEHTSHTQERRYSTLGRMREKKQEVVAEEDIAPGGDYVKLLLLPKQFTPEFRENWELYRAEYWVTENTRRADLRVKWRARKKQWARQQSPWFWWLPGKNLLAKGQTHNTVVTHYNKTSLPPLSQLDRSGSTRIKRPATKDGPDHSRSSSRSSRRSSLVEPTEDRERRYSSASTASSIGTGPAVGEQRRRRKVGGASEGGSIGTSEGKRSSVVGRVGTVKRGSSGSRPVTPPTQSAARFGSGSGTEGESPRKIKREIMD
jgi:hypothetical protein